MTKIEKKQWIYEALYDYMDSSLCVNGTTERNAKQALEELRVMWDMDKKNKETCKTCVYCSPSYKGGVCQQGGREKKVRYSGGCDKWEGRDAEDDLK